MASVPIAMSAIVYGSTLNIRHADRARLKMNAEPNISHAAELLKTGRLVAFPTETVYGLGANAMDPVAVARIFEAKQRPEFDPLIVHIAEADWIGQVVKDVPRVAQTLIDHFWPGPLTLVLPKQECVPDLVSSGLSTVGVRQPNHPIALDLIAKAATPIAAPSANLFGRISPTTAQHVADQLADRIDYIVDGGPCAVGVESTVVTFDNDTVIVLRPGGLTLEQLRAVTPDVVLDSSDGTESEHSSPGRTLQHYAPRTRLVIRETAAAVAGEEPLSLGLLSQQAPVAGTEFAKIEQLGSDLTAAAAQFFAAMRRLDSAGLDLIIATPFPTIGLGVALNDRLMRAASGSEPA